MEQSQQKNPHTQGIIQKLKSFWIASITPNNQIALEIQKHHQKENQQIIGKISNSRNTSLQTNKNSVQLRSDAQGPRKMYQIQRKVAYKQEIGFIGIFLSSIFIIFLIAFIIDLYFEYQTQLQRKTKQISQCFEDLHLNNCNQPLQALVNLCRELQFCASRNPSETVRYSQIVVKTFAALLHLIMDHLQITGLVFVLIFLIVYLNRPTMYQQQKIRKYQ